MTQPLLSAVWSTFGQPNIWKLQWDNLSRLPDLVAKKIELVIVDDHGDPPAEIPRDVQQRHPCKLFRVDKQIPWNQPGARNLGMLKAEAKVAIMLDPDMIPSPIVWDQILARAIDLPRGKVVKFGLLKSNGNEIYSSPNTWILHTDDFFDIGGYNEDYAGSKGWSDVELMHKLNSAFKIIPEKKLLVPYIVNEDGFDDAQVTSLDRSVKVNAKKHKAIWKQIQRRHGGNWARWARKNKGEIIRFPWHRLI